MLARQGDQDALAELAALPSLPPFTAHLWRAFQELSLTRGSGGFGPAALTRLEVRLWEADSCRTLEPWERRAIFDLDRAWLSSVAEQTKTGK